MPNLTITADEETLRWARIEAAKRNTSVARLVGDLLREKMQKDETYDKAMREALKFQPLPLEGRYLTRDEIYAERLDRFR
jgi:hypothetical protein